MYIYIYISAFVDFVVRSSASQARALHQVSVSFHSEPLIGSFSLCRWAKQKRTEVYVKFACDAFLLFFFWFLIAFLFVSFQGHNFCK